MYLHIYIYIYIFMANPRSKNPHDKTSRGQRICALPSALGKFTPNKTLPGSNSQIDRFLLCGWSLLQ